MEERSLRDLTKWGSTTEVAASLGRASQQLDGIALWIGKEKPRNDEMLAFFNLATSSASYAKLAGSYGREHISVLALATRNLYEINLRTRDVLRSDQRLKIWNAEAIKDQIVLLQGLIGLDTKGAMNSERQTLKDEINRLIKLRKKYNMQDKSPIPTAKLAKVVGLESEHRALFKLFSKLVHPTSYLVNNYENAAAYEIFSIMELHAQLYAADTFKRIADHVGIPESEYENLIDLVEEQHEKEA